MTKNEVKSISSDKNIMLVPQTEFLSGKVTFKKNGESVEESFSSDFTFEEGKKYSIIISFTGDDVVVLMVQAGLWDDEEVTYEFE